MPNIRENSAPSGIGLSPSETGVEATAGAARRIGGFYNQVSDAYSTVASVKQDLGNRIGSTLKDVGQVAGEVVAYEDHKEISQGAAHGADMVANLNNAWNAKLKDPKFDPNDATAAAQFRQETLEPALEQFKQGFNTEKSQEWADHFVNQYRQHMVEKTSADMSTMAGIAVKTNAEKTINSLSSAVAADPSSLDFALKSVDHSLGGVVDSSPNLDAATAANVKSELSLKAKESIVKSAVSGMIAKNPNVDLDAIQKKYPEYINGAELKQFQKAAQVQAKTNALQDKQMAVAEKQAADLKVHTGAAKVMTDNISFDPNTGHPIVDPNYFKQALDLAKNNPNAPSAAETVRTMLSWGESQQNKSRQIVDDPNVRKDLTDRMFDPDHPTTRLDLMKAQADGKLSNHSFQAMAGLVKELETTPLKGDIWKSTTQAVKDRLIRTDLPEGRDTVGAANYATFMQSFLPTYIAKSRAGTLEPNALNLNDPKSMISQAIQPFKSSLQDRLRAQSSAPPPAAAPAKREDAMPAIPPADQRSPGLYQTPRGNLRWTGTGWVAP